MQQHSCADLLASALRYAMVCGFYRYGYWFARSIFSSKMYTYSDNYPYRAFYSPSMSLGLTREP